MRDNNRKLSIRNCILTAVFLVLAMILVGVSFDYFFDLNDDVLMKDIVSGAYTGSPESHNIQMEYPLSLFLALLYYIPLPLDWYGLFLAGVQWGCIALIIWRTLDFLDHRQKLGDKKNESVSQNPSGKEEEGEALKEGQDQKAGAKLFLRRAGLILLLLLLLASMLLSHMVFLQYTFVCAMASGTAAFLFLTGEKDAHFVGGIIALIGAFLLRSEMMLLTLPLVLLALLFRLFADPKVRGSGKNMHAFWTSVWPYITVLIWIVLGVSAVLLWNQVAYASKDWQEFKQLFNARTELYDFQEIPSYPEDASLFRSLRLEPAEAELLQNYNYGLDDEYTADAMEQAADYAAAKQKAGDPFSARFARAFSNYVYRTSHFGSPREYAYPQTDAPYNIIVIGLYVFLTVLYLFPSGRKGDRVPEARSGLRGLIFILPQLFLLLLVRSGLWLFILYRGRDPIRITHGLYFVEICLLGALLLRRLALTRAKAKVRDLSVAAGFLSLLLSLSYLPAQAEITAKDQAAREEVNRSFDTAFTWCRYQGGTYSFMDVYSSVAYSQKAFARNSNGFNNFDVLGGWACGSPIYRKKMDKVGLTGSVEEALLHDHVFFITEDKGSAAQNTGWLYNYYVSKGKIVNTIEVGRPAQRFVIYEVKERQQETVEDRLVEYQGAQRKVESSAAGK